MDNGFILGATLMEVHVLEEFEWWIAMGSKGHHSGFIRSHG
jgi:hypothetical protein